MLGRLLESGGDGGVELSPPTATKEMKEVDSEGGLADHRSSFPHLERLGCVKRQRGFSQAGEINEN